MKRLSIFLTMVSLVSSAALSQTQPGDWELSLTGNAGSYTSTYEYTSSYGTSTGSSDITYIGLDLRAGVYYVDGLSLEPEVYWLAAQRDPPTYNLGLNVAYTFDIPQSSVRPYVTAGYGVGNGIPLMQRLTSRASDKLDIPVLRLGGGLKIFVAKYVALKVEYRYERYTQESSGSASGYFSYSAKEVKNFNNILIGFSIFLPKVD